MKSPGARHHRVIRNVLERADREGTCFDVAERGLCYYAFETEASADLSERLNRMFDRVRAALGLRPDDLMVGSTTLAVHRSGEHSAYVVPIALWNRPVWKGYLAGRKRSCNLLLYLSL